LRLGERGFEADSCVAIAAVVGAGGQERARFRPCLGREAGSCRGVGQSTHAHSRERWEERGEPADAVVFTGVAREVGDGIWWLRALRRVDLRTLRSAT
jgi:hypothetical protein